MAKIIFRIIIATLPVAVLVFVLASCDSKKKTKEAFYVGVNESLTISSDFIRKSTESALMSLENKAANPVTKVRAEVWLEKASIVRKISNDAYKYLDSIKQTVVSKKSSTISKTIANSILNRLKEYETRLLGVDLKINNALKDDIVITPFYFDSGNQNTNNNFFDLFESENEIAVINMLINRVVLAENKVVFFCDNNVTINDNFFSTYSCIIATSTSYVKGGEEIEITAGIGSFTNPNNTEIIINNKAVSLSGQNTALYTFKAAANPGKYRVPVKITYIDQDGNRQTVEKQVEYTVAQ